MLGETRKSTRQQPGAVGSLAFSLFKLFHSEKNFCRSAAVPPLPRRPACHPLASSPSHRLASAAFHLDHTAAVPPPTSSWALTMGNNVAEVRDRLLAAWVVWGARLRRGPGAPLTRRGVSPTLTKRGEARTAARFINSTHLLVPSPVQRRSGRLPPRPPGPLRVLELCLSTASALAAPLWGVA